MNNINTKIKIYTALAAVACLILCISLASLSIGQSEEYRQASEQVSERTIAINGQRGDITDKNGVVLATNEQSFSVKFARDVSKTTAYDRSLYTQSLLNAITTIEEGGGKVIDSFNIKRDDNMEYYFDFGTDNEETQKSREEQWRDNFYLSSKDYTVEEMYVILRDRYEIPPETDFETAVKILSIWQEVQMNAFRSYYDIVISTAVDRVTVSKLEAMDFYDGCIQILEDYTRVYPKGNTAAHILGYTGKQTSQEQIEENELLGYLSTDEIGITGIETTMESNLTGSTSDNKGSQVVEVNNVGKVVREISSTPSVAGDTVMLTIDYELQKKAEEALAQNIAIVREEQEELYNANKASYDAQVAERGGDNPLSLADKGAVVVMDVKTGEILAMASYPDYDPNLFVGGIETETFTALNKDPSAPLYNKAISGGTPGSVFKMVTGTAALMEGHVTVNEEIDDAGMFTKHLSNENATGPACWTDYPSNHQNQDMSLAIQNSCNYYFYEVSYRMGIDMIVKWADEFGLTEKTNVELTGELTGKVGNQDVLYDNEYASSQQQVGMAVLVRQQIEGYLQGYLDELGLSADASQITNTAEELLTLVDGENREIGEGIRNVLSKNLGIPETTSNQKNWDIEISASLDQLRWTANDTIVTGIGQGITTITPIAIARYISALVNGGDVFEARLVDATISADGVVSEKQSTVYNTIDINDEYIESIKEGMQNVVSHNDGGNAISYFSDWDEERLSQLAGKTGTGQVSQIDLENNAWFAAFAPYDEPEIAVVTFLPNGYAGSRASYTVEQIVSYYLDQKEAQNVNTLDKGNTIDNMGTSTTQE